VQKAELNLSRLIVGLALIAVAVLLFVFGEGSEPTAGAAAISVLGIVSIAISRTKRS
jgi:multisubunit Na+/H+ antiporter MnhC subunit